MKMNIILFLIASSVLAITHIIALELFLYWHFWWMDIPMHFLGGSVAALGVFATFAFRAPLPKRLMRIVPVLSFVLIVALSWEVYEVSIGIPIDENFVKDTALDLCMGMIGGWVGFIVGSRMHRLGI